MRDCDDEHSSAAALDSCRFGDAQSQQKSVPDACGVHGECVEEFGQFEAIGHVQNVEE